MSGDTMLLHGREVTRKSMLCFKQAYMEALRKGHKQFTFDGQLVLVAYAKYVVEYAESQLGTL